MTQILDEQSSVGAGLREEYGKLGISLKDADGQLRSTYDILKDLGGMWGSLDSNTQKVIANLQAGANQTQNFSALMKNFQTVLSATDTAMHSFGSASQENTRAMDSIAGRAGLLKSQFQDLATNVIDNKLVKSILNLATNVLGSLNTSFGQTLTQIALLTSVGWGATSLISALGIFSKVGGQIKNFITLLKELPAVFALVASGAGTVSQALGATTVAAEGLRSVALPLITVISTLIVGAISLFDKLNVTLSEQKEIVDGLKGNLNELESEYEQLNGQDSLNDKDKQRLELLNAEIEANKVLLRQEQQKAYEREFGEKSYSRTGAFGEGRPDSGLDRIDKQIDKYNELSEQISETERKITELGKNSSDNAPNINKLNKELSVMKDELGETIKPLMESAKSLSNYKDSLGEIPPEADALLDVIENIIEGYGASGDAAEEASESFSDNAQVTQSAEELLQVYAQSIKEIDDAYNVLSDTVSSYNEVGSLTADQLSDLIALGPEYLDLLSVENGQLVLNEEALLNKVEAIKENYIEQLKNAAAEELYAIAVGETEDAMDDAASTASASSSKFYAYVDAINEVGRSALSTATSVGVLNESLGGVFNTKQKKDAAEQVIKDLEKRIKLISNIHVGSSTSGHSRGGGGGGGRASAPRRTQTPRASGVTKKEKTEEEKAQELIEKQTKEFRSQISILKDKLDLLEKSNKPLEDQISMLQQIKNTLHEQAEWYRSHGVGEDSEQILGLQKQWWDAENKITNLHRDAFNDRLSISEKYIEDRNRLDDWGADSEIDAWGRVQEWEKDWYDKGLVDYETYLQAKEKADRAYYEAAKDAVEDSIRIPYIEICM